MLAVFSWTWLLLPVWLNGASADFTVGCRYSVSVCDEKEICIDGFTWQDKFTQCILQGLVKFLADGQKFSIRECKLAHQAALVQSYERTRPDLSFEDRDNQPFAADSGSPSDSPAESQENSERTADVHLFSDLGTPVKRQAEDLTYWSAANSDPAEIKSELNTAPVSEEGILAPDQGLPYEDYPAYTDPAEFYNINSPYGQQQQDYNDYYQDPRGAAAGAGLSSDDLYGVLGLGGLRKRRKDLSLTSRERQQGAAEQKEGLQWREYLAGLKPVEASALAQYLQSSGLDEKASGDSAEQPDSVSTEHRSDDPETIGEIASQTELNNPDSDIVSLEEEQIRELRPSSGESEERLADEQESIVPANDNDSDGVERSIETLDGPPSSEDDRKLSEEVPEYGEDQPRVMLDPVLLTEAYMGRPKRVPPDLKKMKKANKEMLNDELLKETSRQKSGSEIDASHVIQSRRSALAGAGGPTGSSAMLYNGPDLVELYLQPMLEKDALGLSFITSLEDVLDQPSGVFVFLGIDGPWLRMRVNKEVKKVNVTTVAQEILLHARELKDVTGYTVERVRCNGEEYSIYKSRSSNGSAWIVVLALCGSIAGLVAASLVLYILQKQYKLREKLGSAIRGGWGFSSRGGSGTPTSSMVGETVEHQKSYQELCRQRMEGKANEGAAPLATPTGSIKSPPPAEGTPGKTDSPRSPKWPETGEMDISTGHIVLSYMEEHLENKGKLAEEWESLSAYEPEPCSTEAALLTANEAKNRYSDLLPYDHSRVTLDKEKNLFGSDYINASLITDHDPRQPAYIATHDPLPSTVPDFWQMVWEQSSSIIVMLTPLDDTFLQNKYWPSEGPQLFNIYEVNLVSEHFGSQEYIVRSFYLRNVETCETRTVTQFHYKAWNALEVPRTTAGLLEFRRKVNKSFKGSGPIVVHCNDGAGRTGTYILVDMVLNRIQKGAKEIDMAATLEHVRDQRIQMVRNEAQFEFSLQCVMEEVHSMLQSMQ